MLGSEGRQISLESSARGEIDVLWNVRHSLSGFNPSSAQAGTIRKAAFPIFHPQTATRHHRVIRHIIYCF